MKILDLKRINIGEIASQAIATLKNGGIIAYPTESFYALGVLATDERALTRLFDLKKRQHKKAVPVIVGSMEILLSIIKSVPDQAQHLIDQYWPGPLTLIFEAAEGVPDLLSGNTGKVAARIPGESGALQLAGHIRFPVTATSANPSSKPPAETAGAVIRYFGSDLELVLDGGRTPGGKPSTIVDVTTLPPVVLREGKVKIEFSPP